MSGKRVRELAKELDLDTKDLLAKLEKVGIHGKRSQSSLTEAEVERVQAVVAAEEKPSIVVGDERVVHGTEGQTVVERRVGTHVIRRRTTRVEPTPLPSTRRRALPLPAEALTMRTEPFRVLPESFARRELPETPPLAPTAPPAAAAADRLPSCPSPRLKRRSTPEPCRSSPTPPPAAASWPERRTAPQAPELPPLWRGCAAHVCWAGSICARPRCRAGTSARREPQETLGANALAVISPSPRRCPSRAMRSRTKKKRRVIKKPEFQEMTEQERRRAKLPRKKRALPGKELKKTEITTPRASKRVVRISEVITVGELAKAMGVKAGEMIKKLMDSGMMATINQVLDFDTASLIASEFEYNIENVAFDAESDARSRA